ncbi:MAG: hypothetical protein OHK0052_13250 [Anaerolineales bacterium]
MVHDKNIAIPATAVTNPRPASRGLVVFVDSSQQNDAFYRAFGKKIREIREQQGYTQAELAQSAALDRGYLSEIETGKRRVSLYLAYRIANALNCALEQLLSEAGSHE